MSTQRMKTAAVIVLALALAAGFLALGGVNSAQAQSFWTVCPSGCDFTTIQAAIDSTSVANGDVINVSHPAGSLHIEAGILVNKSVTINGQGRFLTYVQAAASPGVATNRVFLIPSTKTVTIQNMTIRYGVINSNNGGAVRNEGILTLKDAIITENSATGTGRGGGLYAHNNSTTYLINVIVSWNTAAATGGGGGVDSVNNAVVTMDGVTIHNNTAQSGGGVRNFSNANMTITNSVIYANTASAGTGGGGGLYNQTAVMTVSNTTISGNSAAGYGGGFYNLNSAGVSSTATLTNVTIFGNTATSGSGIHSNSTSSSVTISNTVVYNNTCATLNTGTITSNGYNLLETGNGCPFGGTNDLTTSDAKLGPLALNGGKTKSHALLDLSPAIDNGLCPTLTADQRGKSRPVDLDDLTYPDASGGDACDIGAFERQATDLTGQVSAWTLNTPAPIASTGITVTVTSGDPGTVTVINRDEYPGGSFSANELQVVWTLTASASPFTADLEFCVTDDVTGITLRAWRWNESTFAWEDQGGSHSGQCVTVSGVTGFSPWTLASDVPTAITLTDFTAQSARSTLAVSIGIVLMAGFLLLLYRRRRTSQF